MGGYSLFLLSDKEKKTTKPQPKLKAQQQKNIPHTTAK